MEPIALVCLPFAGAGASFFRAWEKQVPQTLRMVAVQLPGREERFVEPPHTDAAQAVADAYEQVVRFTGGAGRVAVLGHSLGAVLAFELARMLGELEGITVERLFVSGSPGPWNGRETRASELDDEAFLAQVRSFAGYAHPALENPAMRELLLPPLRADVAMHENYRPFSDKPLPVPITALRGRHDELVSEDTIARWADATESTLNVVELDGGHMYLADDDGSALLRVIDAQVQALQGADRASVR
ncbi:thioesterase II family protein [Streptomyces sp. BA2]|uniref:thioesterase II family protein n=1 Tax=Streptomyces sp. BA2 TaxID=436595 RepID=UPI0013258B22|nr:alpha/beta fold hydrolase [Streptomyces sp. BA2]MWA14155.1 alpha/beta fold hydrolase [Streptomyces sp. BA2]